MSIEQLRCEVEREERKVKKLREAKVYRDKLLLQIRELMHGVEPTLFTELNAHTRDIIRDIQSQLQLPVTEEENNNNNNNNNELNNGLSTSSDAEGEELSIPIFSKEMEERIMQEEETILYINKKQGCDNDEKLLKSKHKSRRRGKKNHKKKNKKVKNDEEIDENNTGLSLKEIRAKKALLAIVESLKLEFTPNNLEKPPSWLCKEDINKEEEEDEMYYSDDFEEISDVECESQVKK